MAFPALDSNDLNLARFFAVDQISDYICGKINCSDEELIKSLAVLHTDNLEVILELSRIKQKRIQFKRKNTRNKNVLKRLKSLDK